MSKKRKRDSELDNEKLIGLPPLKRRKINEKDFEDEHLQSKRSINFFIYLFDESIKEIKKDINLWYNNVKSSLNHNKSLFNDENEFKESSCFLILNKKDVNLENLEKTLQEEIKKLFKSIKYSIDSIEFKFILIYTGHGSENANYQVPEFINEDKVKVNFYDIHKVIENLEIEEDEINPILNITIGNCCRKFHLSEGVTKLDVPKFSGYKYSIFDFVGNCLIFSCESDKLAYYGDEYSLFSECFWNYWKNEWNDTLITINSVLQFKQKAVKTGILKKSINRKTKIEEDKTEVNKLKRKRDTNDVDQLEPSKKIQKI
jgi:hypothetical protein